MFNSNHKLKQVLVLSTIILAALFSRLIPHPPNFAPITAVSVFAGFYFSNIWLALSVPLVSMVLSDGIIGFHPGMALVYGCFAITTWCAHAMNAKKSVGRVIGSLLGSNLFFFLVTNFAAWPGNPLYAQDISGLFQSYLAALPFYGNSLAGDALYAALIFGAGSFASQSALESSNSAA